MITPTEIPRVTESSGFSKMLSSIQPNKNKINSRPSRLRAWLSGVRCLHLALVAFCLLIGTAHAAAESGMSADSFVADFGTAGSYEISESAIKRQENLIYPVGLAALSKKAVQARAAAKPASAEKQITGLSNLSRQAVKSFSVADGLTENTDTIKRQDNLIYPVGLAALSKKAGQARAAAKPASAENQFKCGDVVYFTKDVNHSRFTDNGKVKKGDKGKIVALRSETGEDGSWQKKHRVIRVRTLNNTCGACGYVREKAAKLCSEPDFFCRKCWDSMRMWVCIDIEVKPDAITKTNPGSQRRLMEKDIPKASHLQSAEDVLARRRLVDHVRMEAKDTDAMSPSELVKHRRRLTYGARVSPVLAALMDEIEEAKRNSFP